MSEITYLPTPKRKTAGPPPKVPQQLDEIHRELQLLNEEVMYLSKTLFKLVRLLKEQA